MISKNSKSAKYQKVANYIYKPTDILGSGYSSTVYKALFLASDEKENPKPNTQNNLVAIKKIATATFKEPKNQISQKLLTSQLQILQLMKGSKNTLLLHQLISTQQHTYIITEMCLTDVSKILSKNRVNFKEGTKYTKQIINGFQQMFIRNIIHRDIKPSNLFLDNKGSIKIGDFGFAIKAQDARKQMCFNIGSPLYMAPQSLKKNDYSYSSDIWAFGVTIFEIFTRKTPWDAQNQDELYELIYKTSITEIFKKQKAVMPPIIKELIIRCLKFNKLERISPAQLFEYDFGVNKIKTPDKSFKSQNIVKSSKICTKQKNILKIDKKSPERQIKNPNDYNTVKKKSLMTQISLTRNVSPKRQNTARKITARPSLQINKQKTEVLKDKKQIVYQKIQQKEILKSKDKVIINPQQKSKKQERLYSNLKSGRQGSKSIMIKLNKTMNSTMKNEEKLCKTTMNVGAKIKKKISGEDKGASSITTNIQSNDIVNSSNQKKQSDYKNNTSKIQQAKKIQKANKCKSTIILSSKKKSSVTKQVIKNDNNQMTKTGTCFTSNINSNDSKQGTNKLLTYTSIYQLLFRTIQHIQSFNDSTFISLDAQKQRIYKCYSAIICKLIQKIKNDNNANNKSQISKEYYTNSMQFKKIRKMCNKDFQQYSKCQFISKYFNQKRDANYQFASNITSAFITKLQSINIDDDDKDHFLLSTIMDDLILCRNILNQLKKNAKVNTANVLSEQIMLQLITNDSN